jgi:phosphoribosylformylglycinamidine synthase PurS subunit
MRALRCSAAPSSRTTWTPNLSPRFPSVNLIARVIVTPKPVVSDPQGITIKQGLVTLGFREVSDVRVGKYIEVNLDVANEHEARQRVEAMCKELLANQVIEDYRFELEPEGRRRR